MIDLTIVVPVFNRAKLIGRCLGSCLSGAQTNVEIVVVDDASTDGSVDAICAIDDPRIRLVRQRENAGVCAARNRGAGEARGAWIAFLDSDDELAPGAVDILLAATNSCGEEIGALYHRIQHGVGVVSPTVVPKFGVLDYEDYIALMDRNLDHNRDVFQCMRASALAVAPWPLARIPELEFHLNFAMKFPILMREEILYKVHDDAEERLSMTAISRAATAGDMERIFSMERILDTHGEALRIHGDGLWRHMVVNLLSLELIWGRRRQAWKILEYGLRRRAGGLRLLSVFCLGSFSPAFLNRLRNLYKHFRGVFMRKNALSLSEKN